MAQRRRPAPSMSRVAPRPSRREELLQVAATLFAERGFAGVTVDDIGAASGVTGPALYHHFASKEALLGEMLVAISEHLLEEATSIVASAGGPDEALSELLTHHVEFSVDNQALITVHFRDLVHASEADQRCVRRLQGRYVEVWVDVLTERSPQLAPRVARAAVHATLGLVNSTPFSTRLPRTEMVALLQAMAAAALDAAAVLDAAPGAVLDAAAGA